MVGVPEAHVEPFVPRVTLTLPALGCCREMLFEVVGSGKRAILTRVLAGENLPANRAHSTAARRYGSWIDAALPENFVCPINQAKYPARWWSWAYPARARAPSRTIGQKAIWTYEDGDRFHPASNVAKMSAGHPLTDEDRWPWLQAIADEIDRVCKAGERAVIACSALKRAYREVLVHGRADVRIVFLDGTKELIAGRLAQRKGHFMPPGLLDSQFKTLEPPDAGENPVTVSIDASVDAIVDDIIRQLSLVHPTATSHAGRTHEPRRACSVRCRRHASDKGQDT